MVLKAQKIPNLINGVSQQPPELRFPTQADEVINGYNSVVDGLRIRPPSETIAKLLDTIGSNPFCHTIYRDESNKSVALFHSNSVDVFSLTDGSQKTVTFPDAKGYITDDNPRKDFCAVSIADYTIINNKTKVAAMTTDLSTDFGKTALVFVRQGDYATDYVLTVTYGVTEHTITKTTSDTDSDDIKTTTIADELYNTLVSTLGTTDWEFTVSGSVLLIKNKAGTDFKIKAEDTNGNNNLYAFKEQAAAISDLPLIAPNGFYLRISGEDSMNQDDFYVKFETQDGESFGQGEWVECLKAGLKYKLDATKMPHLLVHEADDTFTFKKSTWGNRVAGDDESAKNPYFIDKTINDLFIYKSRLGFLTEDNISLSRVDKIFEMFRETVRTDLDTDPINAKSAQGSNRSNITILNHAVPFPNELILFADSTQYSLTSDGSTVTTRKSALSTGNIRIETASEYDCSPSCKPIPMGSNIVFTMDKQEGASLQEYVIGTSGAKSVDDITAHAPSYVPKDVFKLTASTSENVVACLSANEKDSIFVYNYFYSGQSKSQSAWCKWKFDNTEILNIEFIKDVLYMVVKYDDGVYLEKIRLAIKATDKVDDKRDFLVRLDRRVTNPDSVYDELTDTTTFTLPYNAEDFDVGGADSNGDQLQIVSVSGDEVTVYGDYTSDTNVIIGVFFEFRYRFSELYLRTSDSSGNSITILDGRLQIRTLSLNYSDTGYFEVHVTPLYRRTSKHVFTGKVIGRPSSVVGSVPISSGTFRVPILSKNDQVTIEIVSKSYLPCKFLGAIWEGLYTRRNQL